MKRFGVVPKPCVIPLFPQFRIVRIHHHLMSPNNPHIREPFCLPCIPLFLHTQDISLFSPFTIWVLRLEGNRFPQDKAVYTTRKKTCKRFFQKNAKSFCAKFTQKLSRLAWVLLIRQSRFSKGKLFRPIHPYLYN